MNNFFNYNKNKTEEKFQFHMKEMSNVNRKLKMIIEWILFKRKYQSFF